ncbi:FAD/NAD(P)-binding protein [Ideonella sp.]|uniref:FAD/NAD(P)-binding protein n=1 Tax=Ideonella sp. TaxID=1929293 RepID=UPI0035B3444D
MDTFDTGLPGPTVAVIGLGFSGTATALHLLRRLPAGARLALFEPAARRGRGLAYGTRCASHWLNVPAGRLGWDAGDEAGFLRWLERRHGPHTGGEYVPRMLLGQYLDEALADAERQAAARGVQTRTWGQAVRSVQRTAGGAERLRLDDGRTLDVDAVLVASGHLATQVPRVGGGAAWGEPGMVADPWEESALAALSALPDAAEVLLLGSGLSAIDVVTWLQDQGHAGRVTLLSRRGLLPQPQHVQESLPLPPGPLADALQQWLAPAEAPALPLAARLRALRTLAGRAAAQGVDWRQLMASLRRATPALWQQLDGRQRRQFLRHLQPWWDTHRHRLAPGIQGRLDAARAAGRLDVQAGRLDRVERLADGSLVATWRPRGTGPAGQRQVAAVVNCTGPSAQVGRAPHTAAGGLWQALQAQGRLQVDALGLGVNVDRVGRLLDAEGHPQPALFYVGPLRKAQDWEAIAIPELRVHAALAAAAVCDVVEANAQRRPAAATIWS